MKLRTRLAVAFLTITIVPMLLFYLLVLALSNYQTRSFTKEYGLTEQVDLFSGNSMQIFNRITKRSQPLCISDCAKRRYHSVLR